MFDLGRNKSIINIQHENSHLRSSSAEKELCPQCNINRVLVNNLLLLWNQYKDCAEICGTFGECSEETTENDVQGSVKYYLKGKAKINLDWWVQKKPPVKGEKRASVDRKGCQTNIWEALYGKNSEAQK